MRGLQDMLSHPGWHPCPRRFSHAPLTCAGRRANSFLAAPPGPWKGGWVFKILHHPPPEHKDLFISPLPLTMAFLLSRPVSSPALPGQRRWDSARHHYQRARPLSQGLAQPLLSCLPAQHVNLLACLSLMPGISNSSLPKYGWAGAPGSTFGQQQSPIPVITLADTILRCHHCQKHHCKLWKVSL